MGTTIERSDPCHFEPLLPHVSFSLPPHCIHPFSLPPFIPSVSSARVGKTCLLNKFSDNVFKKAYITTIGIDFKVKIVKWDTAGQERFRTITTSYFRGAHGIMLCYDITDPKSFAAVSDWMQEIRRLADSSVSIVLIGNKLDMGATDRRVSTADGEELAARFKVPFFETSAKTNENVDAAFEKLAELVTDRLQATGGAGASSGGGGVRISAGAVAEKDRKGGGCC